MANRKSASVIRTEKLPFLVGAVLVLGLVAVGYKASQKKYFNSITSTQTNQTQTFTASSAMRGFTIQVPPGFEVEEKFGTVVLSLKEAKIYIEMNATNFDDLDQYLHDLDQKNKKKKLNDEVLRINNFEVHKRIIEFNSNEVQRSYVFYVDGFIYSVFTDNQSLYEKLDIIAHSFQLPP